MKIIFLGDVFGKPGRKLVKDVLPKLTAEFSPDIIIANGENLTSGKGVNRKALKELADAGVNVFTGGNHSFANQKGNEVYEDSTLPLLRPVNFPKGTPGRGWGIFTAQNGERLLVVSVLGQTFMNQQVDSPFHAIDEVLSQVSPDEYDASLIDIHAEATSEKLAVRWHLDGRVSAVIGTHTHVPTADADISEKGTAFQSDAGMNGSLDSCIGIKKEQVITKLMTQMPLKYEIEDEGRMQFNAVFIETEKNVAKHIHHVRRII